MKILHILDHSLPLHSGYAFRSQNIFKAQMDMGYNPVILTSPKHEESLKKTTPGVEDINGFTYYRSGLIPASRCPMAAELNLMHTLYKRLLQVINIEKPDIIHAHSPVLNAIPAIRAAKVMNLPLVYEIRAFWEDAAVDHGTYQENSWKYRLTRSIETWVCKKVDHVAILCNGLKSDLISRRIPAGKISPVFNGVNPSEFRSVPPDQKFLTAWDLKGKKVIGFVGSFYKYEGLNLLVDAFAQISASHENARLLLVGGGEMADKLTVQIKKLGIKNKVVMPGRIPHERIAGVYALIDILAYPRYSMRLTELVTPLKPLEAMAMGKALVASDVGGHRELIKNHKTGLLFSAGDIEDLSDKIDLILNNKVLETALQKQGNQWVTQHHTWKATTAVYQTIYANLGS